ncbi:N4-gp56 family major capsid protein [Fructilactobacillus sanfranciscensis]|uniref:N4-gp56 family major capsid protein n=1 Tax=Fructilactobacillus sanfranciscensis TaxID=1625 RepID=UPI0013D0F2CC|nr:N4-gp56 family major capsid protein [Fructilactobacillus sanfranciscensis]NDR97417.1 N4-gp56 family major capsid protein [Fructilactobacillus sanfranciscensis]
MADEKGTHLSDLIDPEVMAPIISYQLQKSLRFTPLASVDTTLQGQPGSVLKFPAFTYIGDAEDVKEGESIPVDKIGTTSKEVAIKKAGKGTKITDEAVLSGIGDPVGESSKQLALAIANKVDNDLLAAAKTGTQKVSIDATVDGVQKGIDVFDDEDDSPVVMVVSPKTASAIRADAIKNKIGSEAGADQLVRGTYLDVLGVQIVRSKKLADTEAIFVKVNQAQPALKLALKRNVAVETQRDIFTKTTGMTADEHYGAYLYNDKNVVVGTVNPKA